MITWSDQKLIRVGKRNRQFVLVTCSNCHNPRWISLDNAHRMKSDLCAKCVKALGVKPRRGVTKTCPRCKKDFYTQPIHANRIYCSKECSMKPIVPCETCGKSTKRRFCSIQCSNERFKQRIAKTCVTCGKQFEVTPHGINAQYCSRACYKIDGRKNPNYRNGKYSGDKPYPFPYGGSWYSISQAIKQRDKHCQWKDCRSRKRLQVHHIVKVQDCASLDEANSPENLITYCLKHHQEQHRHK